MKCYYNIFLNWQLIVQQGVVRKMWIHLSLQSHLNMLMIKEITYDKL